MPLVMLPGAPRISAAVADAFKSKEPPFNAVRRLQLSRTEGTEQQTSILTRSHRLIFNITVSARAPRPPLKY